MRAPTTALRRRSERSLLPQVLGAVAKDSGLVAIDENDESLTPEEQLAGKDASEGVVLTESRAEIDPRGNEDGHPLEARHSAWGRTPPMFSARFSAWMRSTPALSADGRTGTLGGMSVALSLWVDRSSLRPDREGRCTLAVELAAAGASAEEARPAARTVLALDVSASMNGEPLTQVIRSVDRLLDALGEDDEVGIVTFSENASRVVEPVRVDAAGRRLVRSRVSRLHAESGTNIEAGLDRAAEMLADTPPLVRRSVVLLSDGAPNVGAHTSEALREVVKRHRPGISFFALGYGVDHSEDVLSAIGEAGGGGYEYIPDPAACARSFARALGTQGDVVASGIEVVIAPAEGVEIIRFVGREETRFSRDGVVVSLPDMINGARRFVVAELRVRAPGGEKLMKNVVEVEASWRERSSRAIASRDAFLLEVADREPALVPEAARRILLARADEGREIARSLADRGQFTGAASGLRALMREIEKLPGWVMNDGSPLAEAYELLVDEATAYERRPSPEAYAAFRKAAAQSKLAVMVPSAARSRGDASQKLIAHVAGDCPEAWLVVVGPNGGRHRLREEHVIGRTNDADIRIESPHVSRRHAEIYADAGSFWVADLGSTNPTIVNGGELGRAPHKLEPGDVIRVGDVELRYEEASRAPT